MCAGGKMGGYENMRSVYSTIKSVRLDCLK